LKIRLDKYATPWHIVSKIVNPNTERNQTMRTYTATPEQAARTEQRRAAFRTLAQRIAELSPDERLALSRRMNVTTVEGHPVSVHNACLIGAQKSDATIIGGFHQWIKAGRCVRKGEHGLMIWAPRMVGRTRGDELTDATPGERRGFIMVTVFDVSQTDPSERGA
jgi:hypothetical protein